MRHGSCGPGRVKHAFGLMGLFCAGICLLGLPLLALALPAMGRGWFHEPRFMWGVLSLTLGLYATGLALSFRHHHAWGPAVLAIPGALLLVGRAAHGLPAAADWGGFGILICAWLWDRRLSLSADRGPEMAAPAPGPSCTKAASKESVRE